MKKQKVKNGFTLVELIVVIAIIAILAAIAVPNLISTIDRSKLAADQATLVTLNKSTNLYRTLNTEEDPFITDGYSDTQLQKVLYDSNYITEEVLKPQTKDASFNWDIGEELWVLSSGSYILTWLNDGIKWLNEGYAKDDGWLAGPYTGDETDISIPNALDDTIIHQLWQELFIGKGLTSVEFADDSQLEVINARAFKDNNLTSIDFPETLTSINVLAFSNNDLQEITLPDSLDTIEYGAFKDNDNLNTVTIGSDVTIGSYAFGDNTANFVSIYRISGAGTYVQDASGNWVKQ